MRSSRKLRWGTAAFGHQDHKELVVQAAGTFGGKVSLQCYGDDSWHPGDSGLIAQSVSSVTATNKP